MAEFPNVVYIVPGATHPNLVRENGESYRLSLERLAKKNKVQKHVIFYNRFVELEELKEFIGAFLLDRNDPTRVIGRLREPLIRPNENEREGYVPNVVYSCGSLPHGDRLILPYAMSDYATTFADLSLTELLLAME